MEVRNRLTWVDPHLGRKGRGKCPSDFLQNDSTIHLNGNISTQMNLWGNAAKTPRPFLLETSLWIGGFTVVTGSSS